LIPLAQQATVLVEVVAPVGVQALRLARWTSPLASDQRDRIQQWQEWGDVLAVAAGEGDARGVPCRSTIT
jgi:hypothetical protein